MSDLSGLTSIQATGVGSGESKSTTELARWVAKEHGWLIHHHGTIHDENGEIIASSIEDLAEAGEELDWYAPDNVGQGPMLHRDPAAFKAKVKSILGEPTERP